MVDTHYEDDTKSSRISWSLRVSFRELVLKVRAMPRIVLFCACCDAGEHHGWSILAVLPDTMDIEPEYLATEVARRSG